MLYISVYLETITCCIYLYIWRLQHAVYICVVGDYDMQYLSVYLETLTCCFYLYIWRL